MRPSLGAEPCFRFERGKEKAHAPRRLTQRKTPPRGGAESRGGRVSQCFVWPSMISRASLVNVASRDPSEAGGE
jgi:hypothetical protein